MRLWRFADPRDGRFAAAGRRGAWTEGLGVCPSCSASRQVRAQPLLLVWEPGSDEVGDFTWPGFGSEVVAAEHVLRSLREFSGFEAGPVEFIEEPGNPKKGKRVTLPYNGPRLFELWVTSRVGMDRGRSSAELEHVCAECGAQRWELYGVERWDSHFDQELKQLVRFKSDRLPNAGIYVEEAGLGGASVFRVEEFPGWIFCTDRVREVIDNEGFSNVSFLEMGETF